MIIMLFLSGGIVIGSAMWAVLLTGLRTESLALPAGTRFARLLAGIALTHVVATHWWGMRVVNSWPRLGIVLCIVIPVLSLGFAFFTSDYYGARYVIIGR